jgi:predicted flap endonuclease-1-like 5' DNA nuclease
MATLIDIEGIGPAYAGKLRNAGIRSTGALLKQGATPKGRRAIAEKAGIDEQLILEWVNHADLYRIKGVGSEYSDLLEEAGVDTVVELARRNSENLHQKMAELNGTKALVRQLPNQRQVKAWIEQAKALPRIISY